MEPTPATSSPALGPALLVSTLLHVIALGGLALWPGVAEKPRLTGSTTLSISLVDTEEAHKARQPAQQTPSPSRPSLPGPQALAPLTQALEAPGEEGRDLEDTVAAVASAAQAKATDTLRSEASFHADYLHNPKPRYPALSRRLGEEGRVLLQVQVSTEGKALDVKIKESSGYQRLDEAAIEVVKQWQFIPAKQGDTALLSWVEVPIQFALEK